MSLQSKGGQALQTDGGQAKNIAPIKKILLFVAYMQSIEILLCSLHDQVVNLNGREWPQTHMRARCMTGFSCSPLMFVSGLLFLFFSGWVFPVNQAYAVVFSVGPGKTYEHIYQAPLDRLNPGDIVKIYYRAEPYREKFIIRRSGTKRAPITIMGISSAGGKRPVIEGTNAIQHQKDLRHDKGRYLIKIGGKSPGNFVVIRNLHLRNANNSHYHLSDEGETKKYSDNAAGIFVFWGRHVTISNCIIQSNGNGILSNHSPKVSHTVIRNCIIFDNGNFVNPGSSQQHNVYLQGKLTTVEFSRFGSTHSNGQIIKDRGLSTVIRYNWIEGGPNRQLDLVEFKGYRRADAFVYGNVIIQGKKIINNQMINFGGDGGISRSGTLYFFNNTVVSKSARTLFIRSGFSDITFFLINNAFIGNGKLWNGKGWLLGHNNWFYKGIKGPFGSVTAIRGHDPNFFPWFGIPYVPLLSSPLTDMGSNRVHLPVRYMPKPRGGGMRRPRAGNMDIGAYESAIRFIKPKNAVDFFNNDPG